MAKRIDMKKAAVEVKPLDPKGDTVWLGVVDKDGNAVSIIQSVYHEFGAGIVAKDTGGCCCKTAEAFFLDPEHINHLEPKKRTFHTLKSSDAVLRMINHILYTAQWEEKGNRKHKPAL